MDTGFIEHHGNCSVRAFGTRMDGSGQHGVRQRAHCAFFLTDICIYIALNRIEVDLLPSIHCIAPHTPPLVIHQPSSVIAHVSIVETSPAHCTPKYHHATVFRLSSCFATFFSFLSLNFFRSPICGAGRLASSSAVSFPKNPIKPFSGTLYLC